MAPEQTQTVVLVDGTFLSRNLKGVGRYTWQIVDALDAALPENARLLILVIEGDLPDFREEFRGEFIRIPYRSEFTIGMMITPRLIRQHRVDVFIRPADKIGRASRARTLTVCHDINPLIWAERSPRPWRRRIIDACWEVLRGHAMRTSELVVCNTEFVRDAACTRFRLDPAKTAIGYCGVDARIPERARHPVDLPPGLSGQPFLLTFATGDEREGVDILPALFRAAKDSGYPGKLVLAGMKEGADYATLLLAGMEAQGVRGDVVVLPFLGEQELPLLASLYAQADFYLETSRHEGFGMQLVEAMACGTTCFSSERGALKEVGGGFPLFLDIADAEKAGQEICAAWKRGEHTRDNTGQKVFVERFNWESSRNTVVDFTFQMPAS